MKKLFATIFTIAALSSGSVIADDAVAPFGIAPGTPIQSLNKQHTFNVAEHEFVVIPPNPHKGFQLYYVYATPSKGVCSITADAFLNGREDTTGERIRPIFDELRMQVERKYGKSELQVGTKSWSMFDPGEDWLNQLRSGERYHAAFWQRDFGSKLPPGIAMISLGIRGDNRDVVEAGSSPAGVRVSLHYRFDNIRSCDHEVERLKLEESSPL